jgi:hypothetical protein
VESCNRNTVMTLSVAGSLHVILLYPCLLGLGNGTYFSPYIMVTPAQQALQLGTSPRIGRQSLV